MYWLDIEIKVFATARQPLKNGDKIWLEQGKIELTGVLVLSNQESLAPGENARGHFIVQTPVDTPSFDDWSVKSSPLHTIGTCKVIKNHKPRPGLSDKQQAKARQIEERLTANLYQPLLWSLISREIFFFNQQEGEDIRQYLEAAGTIVRVDDDLYFHSEAIKSAIKLIGKYIDCHGSITSGQARDLLGSSRKFIIPLLEYFDSQGVTVRRGDERVLPKFTAGS